MTYSCDFSELVEEYRDGGVSVQVLQGPNQGNAEGPEVPCDGTKGRTAKIVVSSEDPFTAGKANIDARIMVIESTVAEDGGDYTLTN
ncbi:hypothetical protein OG696_40470 [Streptomyces sp. NBC_00656]|uniref:hypothetical protein n=1 Tax=Streptomyces sp. NBC_00656 TaxID=2903668 RepID=UPI00324A76C3